MSDLDRQATGDHYDEPDIEYRTCPKCGNDMEWEDCWMVDCEDGQYDMYEEDPINYGPGSYETCEECAGNGGWWYCPACERFVQQRTENDHG